MNNFKKLLASAMALTMVTSVVPAVSTDVNAAEDVACNARTRIEAEAIVDAIINDIENTLIPGETDKYYTLSTIPYNYTGVNWNELNAASGLLFTTEYNLGDVLDYEANTIQGTTGSAFEGWTINDVIKFSADCGNNADAITLVGHEDDSPRMNIVEKADELSRLAEEITGTYADGGDFANGYVNDDEYLEELAKYNTLVALKPYLKNQHTSTTVSEDDYNEYMSIMEATLDEYSGDFLGDIADRYAKALLEDVRFNGVAVEDLIDDGTEFDRSDLSDFEEFISNIKEDKNSTLTAIAKYETVSVEDVVADVVAALENMVDEIEEVNTLLRSTNSATREYRKVEDEVEGLVGILTGQDLTEDAKADAVEYAIASFRSTEVEAIETYYDEVFSQFYEVEIVERANGNYTIRLNDTVLARYLSAQEAENFKESPLAAVLTTNVELDAEESYYDLIVANVDSTRALYEACTTDLEGISLSSTLTTDEANLIIAANNALTQLKSNNYAGLTRTEQKAVEANETMIRTLYAKLLLNGNIVKDWWQFENGQWVYYDNGRTVSNVWVASNATDWYYAGTNGVMLTNSWIARDSSGSVWYYVGADGMMVRDTTIDGYYIDANGEWRA